MVIRLIESSAVNVELPAKHGRPAAYVDMDCLWEQLYAVEDLIRHLEDVDWWRAHLVNVGVPQQLRAAITSVRPGIQHRAIEPVARLTGMNTRTIRRRITEFYENRGAHLYFCARPPDRPIVYSVGNVFTPKPGLARLRES